MRTTRTAPNNTRDAITSGKKAAKSAINNREAAKAWYTPQRLFMQDQVTRKESSIKAVRYTWTEEAKAEWVLLSPAEKEVWTFHARNHDERQPFIRDQIIEAIRKNPTRSFQKIAADIDHWCLATAIHQWLSSHASYSVYVERILPLLSKVQMQKHVDFAKLVREYWGQDTVGKKYLWIHFDEKWFFGWLCRANAKKCEQLGLEKNHAFIYHRNHIDKTMVIAVTGFAFKESMENGGHGVKIMMHRVQGARLAKKRVREGRRHREDNKCTTALQAKVLAERLGFFEHSLFPRVAEIVGHNGEYEGYIPVIQGDNAGPHQDRSLIQFCKQHCESMGWLWRPQAPQMPHMNNLDLAVFPAMSRRHAELLRSLNGNRMANPEKVWAAAKEVWDDLPSATIARGFILAFRIAEKVVKNKGSNNFLQGKDGSLHSDVRRFLRYDKRYCKEDCSSLV
ncbi:hypothetical protein MHU86_10704 [Fragilaria crotonensis]|nr:hypothetical protein MHU86_10704 [Fragilaria crotonensis]